MLYKTLHMLAWESGFPAERQTCNSATTGTSTTQKSLGIQFALCPGLSWVLDFLIQSSRLSSGKIVRSTSRNALCVNSATNPTILRGFLILTVILMLSYLSSATGMPPQIDRNKEQTGRDPSTLKAGSQVLHQDQQTMTRSISQNLSSKETCIFNLSSAQQSVCLKLKWSALFNWKWLGEKRRQKRRN